MYLLSHHIELLDLDHKLRLSNKYLGKENAKKQSMLSYYNYCLYVYIWYQEKNRFIKIINNFLDGKISKNSLKIKFDKITCRIEKKEKFFETSRNLSRLKYGDIETAYYDKFEEDVIWELEEIFKLKSDPWEPDEVLIFFNDEQFLKKLRAVNQSIKLYLE